MNINIARFLDRWLGLPICFFLSVLNKTTLNKHPNRQINKILFLELSEMGSAVLSYPAMREIRQAYPGAELYFWIFEKNKDSVRALGIIPEKNLITMRSKNLSTLFIDTFMNLRRIRKDRIDVVIDMELFSRFSSVLTYLSGAAIKAGFYAKGVKGLYRGNWHTRTVIYNPHIHIGRNFLSLAYAVIDGACSKSLILNESLINHPLAIIKIESEQKILQEVWQKLRKVSPVISEKNTLVLLSPGVNDILPIRRWPVVNYIQLIKEILKDESVFVVLVGTESQSYYGKEVEQNVTDHRVINFIGKTDLAELLALCNISKVLISHDSGIVHLASLTGIHVIVLFGPETPVLYAPLNSKKTIFYEALPCSPCISAYNQRKSACRDNKCLKAITPQEVFVKVKEVL